MLLHFKSFLSLLTIIQASILKYYVIKIESYERECFLLASYLLAFSEKKKL